MISRDVGRLIARYFNVSSHLSVSKRDRGEGRNLLFERMLMAKTLVEGMLLIVN